MRIDPAPLAFIDFEQIAPGSPVQRIFNVYSTKVSAFGLTATFRDGNDPAAFQVMVKPLEMGTAIDSQPIKSGYSVAVSPVEKPPLGNLRRELVLSVVVPDEGPREIVMPVYGQVENGVFTVAPSEVEFKAHKLADGDQAHAVVNFLVPSPQEKVEVIRCEPSFIQADSAKAGEGRQVGTLDTDAAHPQGQCRGDEVRAGKVLRG